MGIFESSKIVEEVIGGFLTLLSNTPQVADKLLASKLIIRFHYKDPDGVLLVDCSGETIDIRPGDTDTMAEANMSMSADTVHRFWYGKVNLLAALARQQVTIKGAVAKVMRLVPALKPSYAMYPEYLDEKGYGKYCLY